MKNTDKWWRQYQVPDVPEGESGNWSIERFEISEESANFEDMRSAWSFGGRVNMVAGSYTRLMRNGSVIMSDTFDEICDHLDPIRNAKGVCLVGGLGLGVVTKGCLMNKDVEKVVVVELSNDVINLVGDHYKEKWGDRLEIIQDDIMTWKPPKGAKYGIGWFDIWDDICEDNLKSMGTLNRRFARKTDWKGCWKQEEIKAYR